MKILIVDDNEQGRMILRKYLESDGHSVEEAADGAAALQQAKTAQPDMIITDILMPKMDGFQLCRAVKADDALKGLPLVFYTATYTSDNDRDFALSLGASRFITKPTEPQEFMGIIKDVLAAGEKGLIPPGEPAVENETEYLREHQVHLIKKLEDKLDQLQAANLALAREIEERKKAEQKIRLSEEHFRKLVDHAPIAMTMDAGVDAEGRGIMMNRKFTELFGYTVEDVPDVRHWWPRAYPDEQYREEVRQEWIRRIEKAIRVHGDIEPLETRVACKDGSIRHMKIYMSSIGEKNIVAFEDLTEQKRMEKALREAAFKYRVVANNTSDWEFWFDPEGKFIYSSPSCKSITGHAVEEFMTDQNLLRSIIHPDDRPGFDRHFHEAAALRTPGALQFRVVRPDGSLRWIDHVCQPVFEREGKYLGTRGSNRDITERKQTEDAVKTALAEKEVLLKEVHHRVKNNMQIISSLLNLQAQKVQSPDLKMLFDQTCDRIKSMSMIHEMLYNKKDYTKIHCGEYFNKLVKDLVASARVKADTVRATVDTDEIMLEVDTAIPLGLITNELVTNALKYAFSHEGGELSVSLTKAGDMYTLSVKDNGAGLPESFDYRNADTLGLRLVSVMVKQIRGAFRINSERGTEAIITFKQ